MKKHILIFLLLIAQAASTVNAAPLKVFIREVNAVGISNRDELQATIKALLTTRLNRETITTVGSAIEAESIIAVSYVVAGQIFSLDAVSTFADKAGSTAFVEGEHPGGLIAGVGKLADKLAFEFSKMQAIQLMPSAKSNEIVKINETTLGTSGTWRSQALPGVFNIVAAGSVNNAGIRDLFLADNHRLLHYRHGKDINLVSEKELKIYEKIISVDIIETGIETLDLYLTVVRNEQPASQLWQMKDGVLQLLAGDIPYYFRTMPLSGAPRKLYVQKSGGDRFFTSEIFEAERSGAEIKLKSSIKLPRPATIYTFNQFSDKTGRQYMVTFTPENKLIVFDGEQREVWRSSEVYGGSELYLERQALAGNSGQGANQTYMNQRIHVTSSGNVLIGKNDSVWMLGKKSDYSNGAVYCFDWMGDHLEGKWHTRIAEYYMPDFFYDEKQKEILQLEVVGRPHIFSKGSTVLTVRKVD